MVNVNFKYIIIQSDNTEQPVSVQIMYKPHMETVYI